MSGVTETIDAVMTHVGVREPLMPGKTHKEVRKYIQGGPSALGKIYVDIKFKVPSLA